MKSDGVEDVMPERCDHGVRFENRCFACDMAEQDRRDRAGHPKASVPQEVKRTPAKGERGGECKRTACDNAPATWFNTATQAHYCPPCGARINAYCPPGQQICSPVEARAMTLEDVELTARRRLHEWDDNACCIYCGFDGAESSWLESRLKLEIGADEFSYRRESGEFDAARYCDKAPR